MANHVSVATVIEASRIASPVAFVPLLEIDVTDPTTGDFVETMYFARNSEDITYQGNTYQAAAFDFDVKSQAGQQPSVTVTVHDYTRAVQAVMQQYGGGIGFTVRVLIVNSGNLNQPPEAQETFLVTGASAQTYDVSYQLGAENPVTMRFPRRRQFQDNCQWRYMGPECGYAGPLPNCDFTANGANGCVFHGNMPRFGAFPGIGINQNQGLG